MSQIIGILSQTIESHCTTSISTGLKLPLFLKQKLCFGPKPDFLSCCIHFLRASPAGRDGARAADERKPAESEGEAQRVCAADLRAPAVD